MYTCIVCMYIYGYISICVCVCIYIYIYMPLYENVKLEVIQKDIFFILNQLYFGLFKNLPKLCIKQKV